MGADLEAYALDEEYTAELERDLCTIEGKAAGQAKVDEKMARSVSKLDAAKEKQKHKVLQIRYLLQELETTRIVIVKQKRDSDHDIFCLEEAFNDTRKEECHRRRNSRSGHHPTQCYQRDDPNAKRKTLGEKRSTNQIRNEVPRPIKSRSESRLPR